ncbi:ArsR family transcriptional regulator [Serratia sp. M24T3]|uniref:ArsR family transcriptional regulator n=1 Tax=Serratia sp. M24T3 TaxID=932213 RepID=UPI00030A4E5A|nr:ArsR family transcriptional regulator [Serratia sp. M24T3]
MIKPEDILRLGPASSSELMAALQVSQPTLSRKIKHDAAILKMGKAKSTRYALRRNIAGVESFAVYLVSGLTAEINRLA